MARFATPGNGMQRTFEGSSLETIRHMVASGIGLTVLPRASVADMKTTDGMLQFRHFENPQPSRRVVQSAIDALKAVWHRGAVDADGKTGDGAGLHVDLPVRFFDSTQSGILISRIMTDAEGIRNLVGTGVVQLLGGIITENLWLQAHDATRRGAQTTRRLHVF